MRKDKSIAPIISEEILRIALAGQLFVTANEDKDIMIDNVLEVIHATPNVNVATAILLGIYEEPVVPEQSDYALNATLVHYNKWSDEVEYDYDHEEKVSGYIPKEMSNDISLEDFNIHEVKTGLDNDKKWVSIPNGNVKRKTNTCSLKSWMTDLYKG
jgi:hypothetical protein